MSIRIPTDIKIRYPVTKKAIAFAGILLVVHVALVFIKPTSYRSAWVSHAWVRPWFSYWGMKERRQEQALLEKKTIEVLNQERQVLEAEKVQLEKINLELLQRSQDTDALKQLLKIQERFRFTLLPSEIIFHRRPQRMGSFIINSGTEAGLRQDQGVISHQGVVGRLWSVGLKTSTVLPCDAPNIALSVYVAPSQSTAVFQGTAQGEGQLLYLLSAEGIQVGQGVFTSGLDDVFPRGLLVGYVKDIRSTAQGFQVYIKLAARLDQTRYVMILKPSSKSVPQGNELEQP